MLGIRLSAELERSLDRVARDRGQTKSEVARRAIEDFVSRHDPVRLEQVRREAARIAEIDDPDEDAFWSAASAWDDDAK